MSNPPDRATVATIAIMQMIATMAPKGDLRRAIEDYLRDEFSDCAREVMADMGGAANK
jgi:hypothetical protein